MRDLLLLIPARANSKGLPGKNLASVAGVSLVGRAVLAARAFLRTQGLGARARILVDTDGEQIATEGRRWGADVPFLRPAELAADTTQTVDNVLHAWHRLDREAQWLILLQPTSPMRRAQHIAACWDTAQSAAAPSAVTVIEASHPIALALYGGGTQPLSFALGAAPVSTRRQDNPVALWPNGAVYVTRLDELERLRAFLVTGKTLGVPMDAAASVDIDAAEDLKRARLAAWSEAPADVDGAVAPLDLRGLSLEPAIEAYLGSLAPGRATSAVLCGGAGARVAEDAAAAFALRSVFGAPVIWDAEGAAPEATRRALLQGVSSVRGAVPAEWLAEVDALRRIGA
jgi:CMP-N-acetylneuraminic acid synthetase